MVRVIMNNTLFMRPRLFTPGPTPTPVFAKTTSLSGDLYHRSADFTELLGRCRKGLSRYFGTKQEPLILTSSGSGAMESAMVNFTNEGDEVLVVNAGKFGDRWQKLSDTYNCKTHVIEAAWGKAVDIDAVKSSLDANSQIKAVFIQATESSTGVYHPIEALCKAIRPSFKGLIVVDAISALLAHEMQMDAWGIDIIVGGSQKGFGVAPGLSFIAASEKAWGIESKRSRFYFDLVKEKKNQDSGKTSWTQATTLYQSLDAVLDYLSPYSVDDIWGRHKQLCLATREAILAMGLEPFVKDDFAYSLTSFTVPESVGAQKVLKYLRENYCATYAGGQDQLKGKIMRIAHLGFMDPFELLGGIAMLEKALVANGHKLDLGQATATFLKNI